MNAIKDTWRQLVRRRLWPVAIVLVGAAVAVPMVLAKTPVLPPADPAAKPTSENPTASFVALADQGEVTERRRVLGDEKDPFEPKALPKAKKSKAKSEDTKSAEDEAKTTDKGDQGTTAKPDTGGTVPPVSPEPTATPAPTVPAYSIKVRFGTTEGELTTKTVERLAVLPNDEAPVLIYRGVEDGGKVAVFELTGVVEAQGDGRCVPTPEDCQYVKLRAGETEFITVTETGTETDAQYQLDLVKVYKKETKVSAEELTQEAESLAKASSLRIDGKRDRYRFDSETGTLRRKK